MNNWIRWVLYGLATVVGGLRIVKPQWSGVTDVAAGALAGWATATPGDKRKLLQQVLQSTQEKR